jgi:hypothetical protein
MPAALLLDFCQRQLILPEAAAPRKQPFPSNDKISAYLRRALERIDTSNCKTVPVQHGEGRVMGWQGGVPAGTSRESFMHHK